MRVRVALTPRRSAQWTVAERLEVAEAVVAPDRGLLGLPAQLGRHLTVAPLVDLALHGPPARLQCTRLFRPARVLLDELLPERAARSQLLAPRQPVEPEQQLPRAGRGIAPGLPQGRAVLLDGAAAARRPVETDAVLVRAVIVEGRPVGAARVRVL